MNFIIHGVFDYRRRWIVWILFRFGALEESLLSTFLAAKTAARVKSEARRLRARPVISTHAQETKPARVLFKSIVLSCTCSNVSTARTLVSQPRSEMLRLVYAGCPGGDKRRKGERLSGRVRVGDKARASFVRLHRAEKQFDGVSLARWVSA